jgi:hypothetical protein
MMHAVSFRHPDARNCSPESKMSASCPNEEMRSAVDSLTNWSSSIIEIIAIFRHKEFVYQF